MTILKVLIISLALIPCVSFSQKTVLINKDTLIGYTLKQNDFIFKSIKQLGLYKLSDSLAKQEITNLKKIVFNQTTQLKNDSLNEIDFRKTIKNEEEKFSLKEMEAKQLQNSLNQANKDINKQKVYKWVAIIAGGAISGYLGYKYVTK